MTQDPPAPGSQLREVGTSRSGVTWYVIAHTRAGILMQSNVGGSKTIPYYQWPVPWLEDELQKGAPPVLMAMLVGGAPGQHFERIWDHASDLNVDIDYHVPVDQKHQRATRVPPIPQGVDVLILLVSHMSHTIYYHYKKLAGEAGVPLISLTSKGFKPQLEVGMRRLIEGGHLPNVLQEQYGAVPRIRRKGWWEASGTKWVWREAGNRQIARDQPSSGGSEEAAPWGLVALVLSIIAAVSL